MHTQESEPGDSNSPDSETSGISDAQVINAWTDSDIDTSNVAKYCGAGERVRIVDVSAEFSLVMFLLIIICYRMVISLRPLMSQISRLCGTFWVVLLSKIVKSSERQWTIVARH